MKTTKLIKNNFFQCLIFIISPILSIPLIILAGLSKEKKFPLLLVSLFLGIISYLYLPSISNDKAYYYHLYNNFQNIEWSEFVYFLSNNATDIIFYFTIFLFAKLNIKLSFLILLLTTVTVYLLLVLLHNISNKKYNFSYISYVFCLFLLIFSISPPTLFSGIRFALGYSIALYSIYLYSEGNISPLRTLTYLTISTLVHFSCTIFIALFITFYFLRNNKKICLTLLFISFIFAFIPNSFPMSILSNMNLSGIYEHKINSYLNSENDFIKTSLMIGNSNNWLMYLFSTLWVYITYFYIFIRRNNNDELLNLLILSIALCNIFMFSPTVYNRYMSLSLGVFVLLISRDVLILNKRKALGWLLFIVLSLSFWGKIYAMRSNFLGGFNGIQTLSLPTILIKEDYQYNNFLY